LDYELVALLHKHFGFDSLYLEYEIPWDLFYIHLAVALDLDERGDYFRYVLAGGNPKKWKWRSSDKAGTRSKKSFLRRMVDEFKGMGIVSKANKAVSAKSESLQGVIAVRDPESGEIVKYVSREDMWRLKTGEIAIDQAKEVSLEGRVFKERKG
jgi:hypothetical protein